MNLNEMTEQLKTEKSPHRLADLKIELAGEYSFICGQLEDILVKKPAIWNELRRNQNVIFKN